MIDRSTLRVDFIGNLISRHPKHQWEDSNNQYKNELKLHPIVYATGYLNSVAKCMTQSRLKRTITTENLRLPIPPELDSRIVRLFDLCTKDDPGKRPRFDIQLIQLLDKMRERASQ
ncbi:unnamed protein product [Schistosoma mattheei]|uniref:Uncharacterized protein n=1 Tax=Schistosoma mattheei TaxID=31246 RepID=A0A183NL98_9TREM|nr:unnamed protein product [Schistosoma mattheei]